MLNKIKRLNKKAISANFLILALMFFCIFPTTTNAQCAMCRAALESEENGVKAEAVNDGIVYLMAIPYILVGVAGYFIYRMYRNKKAE